MHPTLKYPIVYFSDSQTVFHETLRFHKAPQGSVKNSKITLKIKHFKSWKARFALGFQVMVSPKQILKYIGRHPGVTYSAVGHEDQLQNIFNTKVKISFITLDEGATFSLTRMNISVCFQTFISFLPSQSYYANHLGKGARSFIVGSQRSIKM